MFTYRPHLADGSDAGEATLPVMIKPGEEIRIGGGPATGCSISYRSRMRTRST